MTSAVWLGSMIAMLGGCSLIYDVDDLKPPPLPPAHYGAPIKATDDQHLAHGPTLVADGSYVYFSNRDRGGDDEDIWRRDRVAGAWTEVREVMPLSMAPDDDRMPRLSASGDQLYLVRPGETGLEIFVTRQTALHTWELPAAAPVLNGIGDERAAAPCDDSATIFVIHAQFPDSSVEEVSGEAFETKAAVGVGDLTDIRSVSASPDCLRLLVAARGTDPNFDLFLISRADRAAPWSAPERLDALSSSRDESSPSATADGEMIVFERDGELWEAHLER